MTVTLKLSPDIERRLCEQAASQGRTIEAYLERLAEQSATGGNGTASARLPEEWITAWEYWADTSQTLPPGTDDSRENIYTDGGE
jgi:hypothetical protein